MGADQAGQGLVEEEVVEWADPNDLWPVVKKQIDLTQRDTNMEAALREALSQFNVTDDVLLVALKVANAIANDVLRQEREKMNREFGERFDAIRPFVELVKPLVEQDLGPFDKIVSLGVEGPDGSVRVVSL